MLFRSALNDWQMAELSNAQVAALTTAENDGQAVRIPAEFRLDADHVSISRSKSGDLVIHALQASRGAALLEALRAVGEADVDLVAALGAEQAGQRLLKGCEAP